MGTVTQYNLANVRDSLGGGNPVYMSNYYRGGPYVPTTRNVTVNEGPFWQTYYNSYYNSNGVVYGWINKASFFGSPAVAYYFWNYSQSGNLPYNSTSAVSGGITYLRGAYVGVLNGNSREPAYQVSRQYGSTQTINTGVPSSGTLYLSQLYGAANP
jgi:hypothetical protein